MNEGIEPVNQGNELLIFHNETELIAGSSTNNIGNYNNELTWLYMIEH